MADIHSPAVVIYGEDDVVVPPSQALRAAQAIPGAKAVGVGHAGHFPWLENAPGFYSAF